MLGQASAATPPSPPIEETYRVRVANVYGGNYQSIAIRKIARAERSFWMVEQRKRATIGARSQTKSIERRWVDGRTCPELALRVENLVQTLRRLDPTLPRGSFPPDFTPRQILDIPDMPPSHGNSTYVGVLRPGGAYAIKSDYEGPLTKWWRATEQALVDCWGYATHPVDAMALPLTLETDADEAPYVALESSS